MRSPRTICAAAGDTNAPPSGAEVDEPTATRSPRPSKAARDRERERTQILCHLRG